MNAPVSKTGMGYQSIGGSNPPLSASLTPHLVSTLAEPFQRGSKRTRTDHAGVGLGLAIVKSITQAHDGALTLIPRAAGGLCVTSRVLTQATSARPAESQPNTKQALKYRSDDGYFTPAAALGSRFGEDRDRDQRRRAATVRQCHG